MDESGMTEGLAHAEALMIEGQNDEALSVLLGIAEDAEEYVDRNCPTTDEVQWFSFPTIFERLAYRRVEKDPRELRDVGEPMDRLYGDLALAAVHTGDYDIATNALKQAVRWNPMGCENRLNLADLFRMNGDINEYLALTYSVFERASDARHLARAFANFSEYFLVQQKPRTAAAALRAGRRLGVREHALDQALDQATGTTHDPDLVGDDEARDLLAQEGLPDGANAEIAICRPGGPAGRCQRRDRHLPADVRHGRRAGRPAGRCDQPYGARPRPGWRGRLHGAAEADPPERC